MDVKKLIYKVLKREWPSSEILRSDVFPGGTYTIYPCNTVEVRLIGGNIFALHASESRWQGIGFLVNEGREYMGFFVYDDNMPGPFAGVWGVHRGEILSPGKVLMHGANFTVPTSEMEFLYLMQLEEEASGR
jgi:hypothetical protein